MQKNKLHWFDEVILTLTVKSILECIERLGIVSYKKEKL